LQAFPTDNLPDPVILSLMGIVATGATVGASAFLKTVAPVVPDPELLKKKIESKEDLPVLDVWLTADEAEKTLDDQQGRKLQSRALVVDSKRNDDEIVINSTPPPMNDEKNEDDSSTLNSTISETLDPPAASFVTGNTTQSTESLENHDPTEQVLIGSGPIMPLPISEEDAINEDKKAKDIFDVSGRTPSFKSASMDDDEKPSPLDDGIAWMETTINDTSKEGITTDEDSNVLSPIAESKAFPAEPSKGSVSPSLLEQESISLANLRAVSDVKLSRSSDETKKGTRSNPIKKNFTKQFQENIHLISTLQDAPERIEESKRARKKLPAQTRTSRENMEFKNNGSLLGELTNDQSRKTPNLLSKLPAMDMHEKSVTRDSRHDMAMEKTDDIHHYIQKEARKTSREIWRRKSESERFGDIEVLFTSREEVASKIDRIDQDQSSRHMSNGRSIAAVKHAPGKEEIQREKEASPSADILVRLPKKSRQVVVVVEDEIGSSTKLFRRPSEAAQESAKKQRVALSLGHSKLVKVSMRRSSLTPRIPTSGTTKVMLTVLLLVSCQRLVLFTFRRFVF